MNENDILTIERNASTPTTDVEIIPLFYLKTAAFLSIKSNSDVEIIKVAGLICREFSMVIGKRLPKKCHNIQKYKLTGIVKIRCKNGREKSINECESKFNKSINYQLCTVYCKREKNTDISPGFSIKFFDLITSIFDKQI